MVCATASSPSTPIDDEAPSDGAAAAALDAPAETGRAAEQVPGCNYETSNVFEFRLDNGNVISSLKAGTPGHAVVAVRVKK
jgi:hypothetical protein